MRKYVGEREFRAYRKMLAGAFKADLFRYCVVNHYGGCYLDAGSYTLTPLSELITAEDVFVSTSDCHGECLNSAFFCSTANNPILKYTIEGAVKAI